MGSSCSSGQKNKEGKKSKKGKGAQQTPRGSNASNSSVYVYQKAATPPPPPVTAATPDDKQTVSTEHAPVEKTDSIPLSLISSPQLKKDDILVDIPEHVRPIFAGSLKTPTPRLRPKKIVLFLCSDNADTIKEREILGEQVIAKVRRHCAERGYELSAIDWGCKHLENDVTELAVRLLHHYRLNCHLVPVLFFNETLGQRSLPPTLSTDLRNRLMDLLKTAQDKQLLTDHYILDQNNSPPNFRLKPNRNSDDDNKLLHALQQAWEDDTNETRLQTQLERLVREVTSLGSQHNKQRCVWVCRKFLQRPKSPSRAIEEKISGEMQSVLLSQVDESRNLQFSIRWSNGTVDPSVSEHAQYLDNLVAQLLKALTAIAENIIEEDEVNSKEERYLGMEKRLYYELIQQTNECNNRIKHFTGQQNALGQVHEYLKNESNTPLVLHGPPGSGKTVLAAKIIQSCSQWMDGVPVIFRFVGLTSDSATTEQVVRSICEQCCLLYGEHPSLASQNVLHLTKELPLLFSKVTATRSLIVILDGIDQVQFYSSLSLAWVPATLAPHVKLIITLRDECPQLYELKALLSDQKSWLSMDVSTSKDSQSIVEKILEENKRTISAGQQEAINKSLESCCVPLYAAVVGHEACSWSSCLLEPILFSEVDQQILHVFEGLEETFGVTTISRVLGYLTTAKHGLMDSEMVDLLCFDDALDQDENELPVLWIQIHDRLNMFLKTNLVGRLSVTHWRDSSFRVLAEQRYLGGDGLANVSRFMVDYFQSKWAEGKEKKCRSSILDQPLKFGGVYNRRKLDELPLHAHRSSLPSNCDFLFDAEWLQAKVCGSDVYQVLEDIKMADSTPDLTLLREFFELSAYALAYDGSQLFSQIVGRMSPPDPNKYPGVAALYKLASSNSNSSNLMPLGPCLLSPGAPDIAQPADTKIYFDSIYRIKDSTTHMLTLSGESGYVQVVNIYEQKAVRTLTGVTEPKDAKMVDEHRALILCNRELKLYDLDACAFEMKLKGVMNQKMPFYDLHDSQHVVSLSRNRMYVNMTNLKTGDYVATFKVGEDRFLNSLLVSANGKMCVCGDETQKPFPLLVWDMDSRKLVYDLRIPHHEFITRLATITHDGHYVASVCKEVDDPSPNFIIVYDLQSGTLFKKWKPEVNTCSIAISSEGGCVISGLEDSTLLVWDLVTGACRFALKGHCAPVDNIRVDDSGVVCVTFDSTGKDRSVRAWNTSTGSSLAVFTPDAPIVCCELSSDGIAVVLGLRGRREILTLLLCTRQSVEQVRPRNIDFFGSKEYVGKVADMSESG